MLRWKLVEVAVEVAVEAAVLQHQMPTALEFSTATHHSWWSGMGCKYNKQNMNVRQHAC